MRTDQILSALPRLTWHLLQGANLASLSLLARGHARMAISYITTNLFYFQMSSGKGLSQKSLGEIFAQKEHVTDIRLARDNWFDQWQSFVGVDLLSLCMVTRLLQPKVIFEIGTFEGISTLHFALNSPDDCRIYTLDLPKGAPAAPNLRVTMSDEKLIVPENRPGTVYQSYLPESGKITELYADTATFDFHPYFGQVDMFFVDGSHSYEYVKSDTENALRCVRSKGVILWHDYGRYGPHEVSRYLDELARSKEIYRLPGSSLAVYRVP